jgi:predicted dehydrogenase
MDAPVLRWGVLGTGWIAERFIASVQRHTRQIFTAVASRDGARAKEFAGRHRRGRRPRGACDRCPRRSY